MFNKKSLRAAVSNEVLLVKTMRPVFYAIFALTCVAAPVLFLFIGKESPDLFDAFVSETIQYCFPFFSSLLTVFILRNFTENYGCEVYFMYQKVKVKEWGLMLLLYLAGLVIPMAACAVINTEFIFQYIKVAAQCVLLSSLAYMLMFLTMSTALSIAIGFIYVLISIYYATGELRLFIFCSYDWPDASTIGVTLGVLLAESAVLLAVGVLLNVLRFRRFSSSV